MAILLGWIGVAQAASIEVMPGKTMMMDDPPGQCAIEPATHTFDSQYFAAMASLSGATGRLLGMFAECTALAHMRQGKAYPLASWTMVILPLAGGAAPDVSGYTRAQVLAELARNFATTDMQKYVDGSTAGMEQRINGLLQQGGYDLTSAKTLGLLGQDDAGVYTGLLMGQNFNGTSEQIAGVIGMTTIGGNMISVNVYRPFVDAGTYTTLMSETQRLVADIVRKNDGGSAMPAPVYGSSPNPAAPSVPVGLENVSAGGRSMGFFAMAAIATMLIGGIVLAVVLLRRRRPG